MCFLKSYFTLIVSNSLYIIDNYFIAVKNYDVRLKLTSILCFFNYKVESTYQLFSTLPMYKPAS
jgi:hypothetical protein